MLNNINKLYIVIIFTIISSISIMAIPPRPNSDFVWIPKHRIKIGVIIPGHWEYRGRRRYKKKIYRHRKYRKIQIRHMRMRKYN